MFFPWELVLYYFFWNLAEILISESEMRITDKRWWDAGNKSPVEKLIVQDKRWEGQFPVTTLDKTDSTRRRVI